MMEIDTSLIFHGTRGPRDAKIMVVGESWGRQEAAAQKPFVGGSGQELDRMLAEANIDSNECFFTNVVNAQPASNDMSYFFYPTREARKDNELEVRGLYPQPIVQAGLRNLTKQIELVDPDLIIGFGNYSLWALTTDDFRVSNSTSKVDRKGRKVPTGIASYRGSQLYTRPDMGGKPFLPTYHPAAILRQWSWRAASVHDLKFRTQKFREDRWNPVVMDFGIRPTLTETVSFLRGLLHRLDLGPVPVSVDLETRAGHIACCGLATSSIRAISIPFMCIENPEGYWSREEEIGIIHLLVEVFSHPNFILIGQNFLYDAQYIARWWNYKVDLSHEKTWDTMVAQHLIFPGTPKGLDYLSSIYCQHHVYWKDDGKQWDPKMGEEQLWDYNCRDAVKTFEIAGIQQQVIEAEGLTEPWYWECEQLPLMLDMMLTGVKIDLATRGKQTFELHDAIQNRVQQLDELIPWGDELKTGPKQAAWYNSPQQLKRLFYEFLGLKTIRNKKTYAPSTDDAALRLIEQREPLLRPVTELISELRSCKVFNDTFLSMKLDDDQRMRCSYNVHPETFRWSSSENAFGNGGNLQNIPKGSEDD